MVHYDLTSTLDQRFINGSLALSVSSSVSRYSHLIRLLCVIIIILNRSWSSVICKSRRRRRTANTIIYQGDRRTPNTKREKRRRVLGNQRSSGTLMGVS